MVEFGGRGVAGISALSAVMVSKLGDLGLGDLEVCGSFVFALRFLVAEALGVEDTGPLGVTANFAGVLVKGSTNGETLLLGRVDRLSDGV